MKRTFLKVFKLSKMLVCIQFAGSPDLVVVQPKFRGWIAVVFM